MAGVMTNGMMIGALLAGVKVGKNAVSTPQARSFSLWEVFDLGYVGSPQRSGWANMNLDTRVAVNTCPLNFGPDGAGDERFYRMD